MAWLLEMVWVLEIVCVLETLRSLLAVTIAFCTRAYGAVSAFKRV